MSVTSDDTAAWREMAYAQYMQAEADCNGELAVAAAPFETAFALWSGTDAFAYAYATNELIDWWERHGGRLTITAWREAMRNERKVMRSEYLDRHGPLAVSATGAAPEDTGAGLVYSYRGRGSARGTGERAGAATARPDRFAHARSCALPAGVAVPGVQDRMPASEFPVPVLQASDETAGLELSDRDRKRAELGWPLSSAGRREVARRDSDAIDVRPGMVHAGPAPVDGDELLHRMRIFLQWFAVWPSEAALTTATLWAAHSHARDARGMLVWQSSPRLWFQSAEPGAGKTHAMRVVSKLCPAPAVFTEPSEPAVAHAIGAEHATLFLEEIDELFGRGRRKSAIKAVINDGYTPDGFWARVRNGQVSRMCTFGALAMAGLDSAETGTDGKLAALFTRCIRIRMRMAPAGWSPPRFGRQERAIADVTARRCAAWCAEHLDELEDAIPELPDGVGGRLAQLWEPLIAIADLAGGGWPEAARASCEELSGTAVPVSADEGLAWDEAGKVMDGWA